jgi:hypothetical protein
VKGKVDFRKLGSATYLKNLQQKEPLWARHLARNFYQNVRQGCSAFQADSNLAGARHHDAKEKDDEEDDGEENDEGEDMDVDEEPPPPASEFLAPFLSCIFTFILHYCPFLSGA